MQTLIKKINPFLTIIIIVYVALGMMTIHNCYFWDVIQQVSKEGFWFYKTNFSSLLIPPDNEYGIMATGYHPPLMGVMTALLWKIFGYQLWVSHAFSMFWAGLLIFHTWKLLSSFLPKKYVGWTALILLLEPAVLSQFAIASPDFILFTAFVISLRGVLERKPVMQGIGLFFLCCVNMRGVFTGAMLFIAHYYYNYTQATERSWGNTFKQTIVPYLPTLLVLLAYFSYFFIQRGWFFTNSAYSEHYAMPHSAGAVIAHFFSLMLRSIENGRIIIWVLACYFAFLLWKKKEKLSDKERVLVLFFLLMYGLYFIFVFISQMPFGTRYFMPHIFTLSLLVLSFMTKHYEGRLLKIGFSMLLLFALTGHLWIYPEKMAKPWDATLAHLPYYELRKKCFDYIDEQELDYAELSSGMSLGGDRGFIELKNAGRRVDGELLQSKYVIYSNICNFEDEVIDTLQDNSLWTPIQTFQKWPVVITIYQKTADEREMGK